MPKISAVIITYNEELFIEKCLASLEGIADEIIVVDSFSTDSTEEICKKYNVRFIKHSFEGYRDQKNFAVKLASYNNILSLDADEALSDELRESILSIKGNWK
jgi:glycosyltransferase involved in cell wall biosynthesis